MRYTPTILLALAGLMTGCAATATAPAPAPTNARPIDAVRMDIVNLIRQMESMHALTSAIGSNAPVSRQNFGGQLRATEQVIASSREDFQALKERADEFLALWGPNVSSFRPNQGGIVVASNEPRERAKAKYDEMVAGLIAARDVMVPLLSSYQQIETGMNAPADAALRARASEASTDGQKVIGHLRDALADLDELVKMLLDANVAPSPRAS